LEAHDIDPSQQVRLDGGQVASQISRQIVQLHARLYGRGPTRAKTYLHRDYVLTILEEIFTPAERTLIGAGKGEHVQSTRTAFQDAVAPEFIEVVEEATERSVRAFISRVHLDTEIAAELFLFEPGAEPEEGTEYDR
jgi:uncharacterized protein YbcI